MRSLSTMNPESTGTVRPPETSTSWVCACPPILGSASNNVTWWVRWSRYAAVRPEMPPPMTATLGRSSYDGLLLVSRGSLMTLVRATLRGGLVPIGKT